MIELEPPKILAEIISGNPQADAQLKKWLNNLYEVVKDNMSRDFYLDVAQGRKNGYSTVHKFGAVTLSGTSLTPVCQGGFYRTPQVGSTVTIEAISDDANDTAAGTGAREVSFSYLDANGAEQTGTIATNGTSASTETVSGVWRIYRAWVSKSGTYASQSSASQKGTITLRESGGGSTWAQIKEIGTSGQAVGQSLIGCYTVPAGKTAYILSSTFSVASGKTPTLYFFARTNADETAAPYSGTMRLKNYYAGVVGGTTEIEHSTYESYSALTDIGFFAVGSNGDEISAEFELLLVDN